MTSKKKVLVMEDSKLQREELCKDLIACGFDVYPAANESEARQQAQAHWKELDVAVIDNELDETDLSVQGAKIAMEFRNQDSFPPEFIIYSSKDELDYYRFALQLGAAAYLHKARCSRQDLIDHVKVLALCRALNPANPQLVTRIAQIAAHSNSESECIRLFCRRVVKSEVNLCLGVPFVLLLSVGNETQNCADNIDGLPPRHDLYHDLQSFAHANLSGPSVLDISKLAPAPDETTSALPQKFDRAALLPLSRSENMRLSIAILHRPAIEGTDQTNERLCRILAQYFRPTVLANIIDIWSQWSELHATRTSTAKLCLAVGQEINYGLTIEDWEQLRDLANDLNDTGLFLRSLDDTDTLNETNLSVEEVVEKAWQDVAFLKEGNALERPSVQNNLFISGQESDLVLIFSRLFQWFMYRAPTMPTDVKPSINIQCEETKDASVVVFEDNSVRLAKELRDDLFGPFTQAIPTPFPEITRAGTSHKKSKTRRRRELMNAGRYLPLYLAKVLVEGRYHGSLSDRSDEITGRSYGHRVVMQLPKVDSAVC